MKGWDAIHKKAAIRAALKPSKSLFKPEQLSSFRKSVINGRLIPKPFDWIAERPTKGELLRMQLSK